MWIYIPLLYSKNLIYMWCFVNHLPEYKLSVILLLILKHLYLCCCVLDIQSSLSKCCHGFVKTYLIKFVRTQSNISKFDCFVCVDISRYLLGEAVCIALT